ncbi:hypothetical protein TNCV_4198331 [Trichonephila clavipes]|nr:hypothetical protein TNCV_4198331 [Trichonephila clavipes]
MTTYSPDLNPMDHSVWSILEFRACTKPHNTSDSLYQSLLREWGILKPKLLFDIYRRRRPLPLLVKEASEMNLKDPLGLAKRSPDGRRKRK